MTNTQWYAVVVGLVVIGVVVFLIASGGLSTGSDVEDSLALPESAADADDIGPDDVGPGDGGSAAVAASEDASEDEDEDEGDNASASAEGTSDGAAPFAGSSALGALTMETPFQFGDLRVAVTDLALSDIVSEGSDEQLAIALFATVRLSVRVTGGEPLSLEGSLQLVDAAGRVFTPNPVATAAAAARIEDRADALTIRLQPGITTDLIVVFDVPNDAEEFRLRLSGGFVDVTLER